MTPTIARRTFLCWAAGAVAGIGPAAAQPAKGVRRVGTLLVSPPPEPGVRPFEATRKALEDLGYVEGRNIVYVDRNAGGKLEPLPRLAAELVDERVDVILTGGSEATRAAKQATATIPIVFSGPSYPVEEGLVASFAKPGGNVTGVTTAQSDHVIKHLQLLRDVQPALADFAILWSPANAGSTFLRRDAESAAASLGLKVHSVTLRSGADLDAALATIERVRPGALLVHALAPTNPYVPRISALAVKLRIPSISTARSAAEAGLLIAYGADSRTFGPRLAYLVDRILKGAKPATLPVERPTKFELTINLKTARTIGITVPQSLRLRADSLID